MSIFLFAIFGFGVIAFGIGGSIVSSRGRRDYYKDDDNK